MITVVLETSSIHVTQAGIYRYIKELQAAFLDMPDEIRTYEMCYEPCFSRSNRFFRAYDTINREILWIQYVLPRKVQHLAEVDLMHTTNAIMPSRCKKPVVVTIHDLHAFTTSESGQGWHQLAFKKYINNVAQHAAAIIFMTNYVKNDFLTLFPFFDESRAVAVNPGVKSIFKVLEEKKLGGIKEKYGLYTPYILGVSSWSRNKNAATTIRSFAKIADTIDHELVFAGNARGYQAYLQELAQQLAVGDRVRFLGYVPDEDLPSLYNLADVFCYPSLYEGFGVPPLEAMRCGTPVLTSNVTCIPEVVGKAALQIDPLDGDQLADALRMLVTDETKRTELIQAGFERTADTSWARAARETRDVYTLVL